MGGCFSDLSAEKQAVGGGGEKALCNDAVDFLFKNKGFQPLFTQLELSLSASKLCDLDVMSKSDPLAVVYIRKKDGSLEEIGRTEVIMNSLEPSWIQKINIAYQFETVQQLLFQVYDVDTHHNLPANMLMLADQDSLGEASCALSEIVTKQNRSLTLNLQNKNKNTGTLTIHAEDTISSKNVVEIKFRCSRLDNKDMFSKSDPFLRISRIVESGGSIPICKTEVIDNNLNPIWKPLSLAMQQYVTKENPLIIECFDYNSNGDHVLIGKVQKSIADLEQLCKEKVGANFVMPPSKRRYNEKVLKGKLFVDGFVEKQVHSFIDYISSGFELNFMVAVDFTASNGDPRNPSSLHYISDSGRLNAYQQAIMDVGEVIQFYDSDKRFPVWGFGGVSNGSVSHCFNLNQYPGNVEVQGVNGIMGAYANALQNVTLSGPTLFGKIINEASEIAAAAASSTHDFRKYFVLLIITDGILSDLQETKDAIVRASDLPLSILIVGVGQADFKQMEILDADKGERLQSSSGRLATRDIVQFVPMRDVQSGQISLVEALLEELPDQFLSFMKSRNINPNLLQPSAPF